MDYLNGQALLDLISGHSYLFLRSFKTKLQFSILCVGNSHVLVTLCMNKKLQKLLTVVLNIPKSTE